MKHKHDTDTTISIISKSHHELFKFTMEIYILKSSIQKLVKYNNFNTLLLNTKKGSNPSI